MAVMQASEASINFVKTRLASPDGKLWGKAPGMVLIKPTSIAYSGTSATVGENGQVTFSAVTSLSLNGVFSADFDNYVISLRTTATANLDLESRLRASGTDASGGDYTWQRLFASSTTVAAGRTSGSVYAQVAQVGTGRDGTNISFYGPYLAQPTAYRTDNIDSTSSARLFMYAGTHSLSTSYDGYTLLVTSGNITGALQVYGVRS